MNMTSQKKLLVSALSLVTLAMASAFVLSIVKMVKSNLSWSIVVSFGILLAVSLFTTLYISFYEKIRKKDFPVADERQLSVIGKASLVSFVLLSVLSFLFGLIDFMGYGTWAPLLVQSEIAIFVSLLVFFFWCTFTDSFVFFNDERDKLLLKGFTYLLISGYSILGSALDYQNKPMFLSGGRLALTSFNYILGIFAFLVSAALLTKYALSRKEADSEKS